MCMATLMLIAAALASGIWLLRSVVQCAARCASQTFQTHVVMFIDPALDADGRGPKWASDHVLGTMHCDCLTDTYLGLHLFGKLVNSVGRRDDFLSKLRTTHVHVVVPQQRREMYVADAIRDALECLVLSGRRVFATVYFVRNSPTNDDVRVCNSPSNVRPVFTDGVHSATTVFRVCLPKSIDFLLAYSGAHITSDVLDRVVGHRRVKNALLYTDADTGRYGFSRQAEYEVAAAQDALRHLSPAEKSFLLQAPQATYAFCPGPTNQVWFRTDVLHPPSSALQLATSEHRKQWFPELLDNDVDDFESVEQSGTVERLDTVVSKSAAFFIYAATLQTWQGSQFWHIGSMFSPSVTGDDEFMLTADTPLHRYVDGCFRARQLVTSTDVLSAWSIKLATMGATNLRDRVLPLVRDAVLAEEMDHVFGSDSD